MEIRDPVHGSIHIDDGIIPIIQSDFFQRLRGIKQLGFSEYVFPGATHSRFLHSIGVMKIGTMAFDKLFKNRLQQKEIKRLRETFKLACLLHDIGHAPLSHASEVVMPKLSALELPKRYQLDSIDRQASHEDFTVKAIVESSLTQSFTTIQSESGVEYDAIAELVTGVTQMNDYFTVEGINYFPLLHQLISSELDCDRMDYLLRDSYFCGVSYGNYDLDWLLDNLDICLIDHSAFLGISERAVVTFDDFLLSRFHMFLMVYFHYRSVCLERLLTKYFHSAPNEYVIPSNIEEYLEHDDHYLMKIMRKSSNEYAQAIVKNQIPPKIFESFNEKQLNELNDIENFLKGEQIDYIRCSSQGRLSKYYEREKINPFSLKVIRTLHGHGPKILSTIDEATDLFEKFSKSHAVNRLHCHVDQLTAAQLKQLNNLTQRGAI